MLSNGRKTVFRGKPAIITLSVCAFLLALFAFWYKPLVDTTDTASMRIDLLLFLVLFGAALFLSRIYSKLIPPAFAINGVAAFCVCLLLGALFFWLNFDYVKGLTEYTAAIWGDPTAYYTQARMLADGRLSAPSPPYPDCLSQDYCINHNGRFFGKYPPGWPALLAIGLTIGVPWVMNPLVTAAGLFTLFLFARRFFDSQTALIAFVFASTSPIIFWAAKGYFSEPLAFLSTTIFIYCSFRALLESKWVWSVPAGMALGVLFLTRPFTAFAICIPIAGFWLFESFRAPAVLFRGAVLAASALPFFLLHFAYNRHLTGSFFTFPHNIYNVYDKLGFGLRSADLPLAPVQYGLHDVPWNLFWQIFDVAISGVPLAPLLFGGLLLKPVKKSELMLIATALSFFGLHVLFHTPTVRYHFPNMAVIAVGCAAGLIKIARFFVESKKAPAAALFTASSLSFAYVVLIVIPYTLSDSTLQTKITDPFIQVKRAGLAKAIVVIRSTPLPDIWNFCYTQNAPRFQNDVLYVNNCGDLDSLRAKYYPDRSVYYYDFDRARGRGTLCAARKRPPASSSSP